MASATQKLTWLRGLPLPSRQLAPGRYRGLILAAALAPRPSFRIVRDPLGTAVSGDQIYDMPTIRPSGFAPGSPTRTKPLASATRKEWPQRGYAPHGCLRVLVFENLGIRSEYTPVLAKHSKHFSLEDSLAIGGTSGRCVSRSRIAELNICRQKLRQVLDDDADTARYIENLRRAYRFRAVSPNRATVLPHEMGTICP